MPSPAPVWSGLLQRKCACGGTPGPAGECAGCRRRRLLGRMLQTGFRVNQPDDRFEQEADSIVAELMGTRGEDLQRQADEEEEEFFQTEPLVQRRVANDANDRDDREVPLILDEVLRSPGRPLEPATRAFMESRFGHDFSEVRVHTDAKAAESARAVNALAYTVGRDIAFDAGQYAPEKSAGQRLLAHELIHVLQKERTPELIARQVRGSTGVREPQTRSSPELPPSLRTFRWPRFINEGESVCAPGVTLGVNPGGQFLNAMELMFTEREEAGERRRALARGSYSSYRVRQTYELKAWEFVRGQWFQLATEPAGTPDDPDPELQCWNPPELRTVDTPGWSAYQGVGPMTRQFALGGGRKSDPNATVVWVQMNFFTWVEGERTFVDGWEEVSVKYPWHSSLRLERPSPTANWQPAADNRIQGGHMEFGTRGPRP